MRKVNNTFAPPTRSPSFGTLKPVRSYVLDKSIVKDHKTGLFSDDPSSILDGNIDEFLKAARSVSRSI